MLLFRTTIIAGVLAIAHAAVGQDVRSRIRLAPRGTVVNQAQAETLTLTMGAVTPRLVQTWVRVAGTIDGNDKVIAADVNGPEAALVKVGQRARAFPPSAKSSMYQAFVTRVTPKAGGATVEVSLAATGRAHSSLYVVEIVVELGPYLSVPNEAIIEEGSTRVVYVQGEGGQYTPHEIHAGLQGELYTQVLDGVKDGDQVVTFGSFFIDAEHKLKGTEAASPPPAVK
jgi:membrane fusion protein, copper/silver efflux system